jgi:hypothetical protein
VGKIKPKGKASGPDFYRRPPLPSFNRRNVASFTNFPNFRRLSGAQTVDRRCLWLPLRSWSGDCLKKSAFAFRKELSGHFSRNLHRPRTLSWVGLYVFLNRIHCDFPGIGRAT